MRYRWIVTALLAVLAIGATIFACSKLDLSALASASPKWVLIALGINAASMLLRAFAWLGMLRGALPGEHVPSGSVVRATMIGVLGSALAPGRVGEPLRTWLVARALTGRDRLATVIGTVLSQTLLNLVALALLIQFALPVSGSGLWTIAWPVVLAITILFGTRLARHGRFARQFAAARNGLRIFRQPRRGIAVTALQLGAWALQTLAAYALLRALDIHVLSPLATAAAILVAVNVTAAVPVTPSNIGIFQAACIGVLASVGVAYGAGMAYGLLLQGAELVTAVVLGLPAAGSELWLTRRGS